MEFNNVDKLLSVAAVCNDCESVSESTLKAAWKARLFARNELMVYLVTYLGDEAVQCYVTFPFDDIEVTVLNEEHPFDSEFIYLPFGWFSLNLWNALLQDKNNLLFRVLRYFSWNVEQISNYLEASGVELDAGACVTSELLSERGILDIFSLHSYIGVYKNVDNWIGVD